MSRAQSPLVAGGYHTGQRRSVTCKIQNHGTVAKENFTRYRVCARACARVCVGVRWGVRAAVKPWVTGGQW